MCVCVYACVRQMFLCAIWDFCVMALGESVAITPVFAILSFYSESEVNPTSQLTNIYSFLIWSG